MKNNIRAIIEGWSNYFQGSGAVALAQASERATICAACPDAKYGKHAAILPDAQLGEIQGHYCGVCKCPLSTAVRSSGYHCPKNKW
ncbi:hypothetical protein NBRC110019_20860 [Neptunitalea chrysea]|uniref:Uncharacterized protein n=1 Tax=Neptunitalea chrysea TaxID=1647581 RepID=A0A9W6EVK7_9FLAO|nr:hypothetical protein [Neptunitalea chrysea]GLB53046.1 hypothetical protein NBRC110019_20860 [Neptunitalea chrysea]